MAPAWMGVGVTYSSDLRADWISGMMGRSENVIDTKASRPSNQVGGYGISE